MDFSDSLYVATNAVGGIFHCCPPAFAQSVSLFRANTNTDALIVIGISMCMQG